MRRVGKIGKHEADAMTQSASRPSAMSLSRTGTGCSCGARTVITPSSMPDARTRPSLRYFATMFSSGVMSMRSRRWFSSKNGTTSRLRETMRSMEKSSSSVATICRTLMRAQSSRASSRSPCATSAALIAPIEVPYTASSRTPSSRSACHAPISYAPREPPPLSTSARFMCVSSMSA